MATKLQAPKITTRASYPDLEVAFQKWTYNENDDTLTFELFDDHLQLEVGDYFQILGLFTSYYANWYVPPPGYLVVIAKNGNRITAEIQANAIDDVSSWFYDLVDSGLSPLPNLGRAALLKYNVDRSRVIVAWEGVANAKNYTVQFYANGSVVWTEANTTKTYTTTTLANIRNGVVPTVVAHGDGTNYSDSNVSEGQAIYTDALQEPALKFATPAFTKIQTRLTTDDVTFNEFSVQADGNVTCSFTSWPSTWKAGDRVTFNNSDVVFEIIQVNAAQQTALFKPESAVDDSFDTNGKIYPYDIAEGSEALQIRWTAETNPTLAALGSYYVIKKYYDDSETGVELIIPQSDQRTANYIEPVDGSYSVEVKRLTPNPEYAAPSEWGIYNFKVGKSPEVLIMGDKFGAAQIGRAQQNGRFYSIRETDVPANTVFMPAYSTSPFFGINEVPVPANKLGAYATTGIFCFDFPDGWISTEGQAVYYKPTSATEGTFSATSSAGAVRIGFEVFQPNVAGKLCVYIQPGAGLES